VQFAGVNNTRNDKYLAAFGQNLRCIRKTKKMSLDYEFLPGLTLTEFSRQAAALLKL
jgi:hypothetical protein